MISGFPIKLIIPIKNFIKAIVTFTDFQFKLSFLKKIINLFYFYFYYIVFFCLKRKIIFYSMVNIFTMQLLMILLIRNFFHSKVSNLLRIFVFKNNRVHDH